MLAGQGLEIAMEGEVVADEDLVADRDTDRAGLVVRVPDPDRDSFAAFGGVLHFCDSRELGDTVAV